MVVINGSYLARNAFGMSCIIYLPILEDLTEEFWFQERKWPVAEWKFYIAFSLFRGASIYAGVYNRWVKVSKFVRDADAVILLRSHILWLLVCNRVMHQEVSVLDTLKYLLMAL